VGEEVRLDLFAGEEFVAGEEGEEEGGVFVAGF